MKIRHFLYNAFLIEHANTKLAIDPGALFFYYFRFTTLIPRPEWEDITHILITHGDPDHYWHADRVAAASDATIIFNQTMLREKKGKVLALGPRARGVAFTTQFKKTRTISVDETIDVDGIPITGIKATHGPLVLRIGPLSKTVYPGPGERIGWGSIGFLFEIEGKRFVNLGDTLLHEHEWESIQAPDVLMIPIGGRVALNTMGETEALRAVDIMQPKLVIPCHYNCPGLFSKHLNPGDDAMFKREVEKRGIPCRIMYNGDSLVL